ncbi:hypothetical protein HDU97_007229 [Phlyctochytrium planicorne]|nr:hypothetical protein HDU97_007229 [Phlyctochytrium planicorne]
MSNSQELETYPSPTTEPSPDPGAPSSTIEVVSSDSGAAPAGKKKPGRKPIDPAIQKVKRKDQNREAQRKFRERKEVYIKELESKIQMIEGVIRESAAERNRMNTVIMRLQQENDNLKAMMKFGGGQLPVPLPTPTPTNRGQDPFFNSNLETPESRISNNFSDDSYDSYESDEEPRAKRSKEGPNVLKSIAHAMTSYISPFGDLDDKDGDEEQTAERKPSPPSQQTSGPSILATTTVPQAAAVISAAHVPLISKLDTRAGQISNPASVEWDLAASTLNENKDGKSILYSLPKAEDVLARAPPGWRPCMWPPNAKEDSDSVRLHTRICSDLLMTRAAALWQLRGPPPYHPIIDLIPCAEMRDALIYGNSGIDLELFAADVNISWRVPPEFWHRYPIMIAIATPEYFEVGLEDPKVAKEWAVTGAGCPNPIPDLPFPDDDRF